MKKGDSLLEHRERMQALHAQFLKKSLYHSQKAYLELKDIYWLVHEFFSTFLGKQHHFTEEELVKELEEFKHEYLAIPATVVSAWKSFFEQLSALQYAGAQPTQEELKELLVIFTNLVEDTVGKDYGPGDAFARAAQQAHVYVTHGQVEKAEEIYHKLMHEYESLSANQKRTHFAQLDGLYRAIAAVRSGTPIVPQQ